MRDEDVPFNLSLVKRVMDTIAQHHKKLASQFVRRGDSAAIVASAKKLAVLVLKNEELHMRHRKKMLKEVMWWISEADGKYSAQYRSKAVVDLARSEPTSTEKIQHEHVFPRAKVADELLQNSAELLKSQDKLDEILDRTVGCVVLASEHRQLDDKAEGWKRYAKVTVWDMSTDPPTPVP